MFDEPLQSVREETLASFRSPYVEFEGEALRSLMHLLLDRIEFACIKLRDGRIESDLKSKCRGERRCAIVAFVGGDLGATFRTNQIGYLSLTEARSFSICPQIVVEF